jgi:hypothetical protein
VPNLCRPVDPGSVPFLSRVCPDEQLFPPCPVLTSYRDQIMKLHSMTRHSRQRSAPSPGDPFVLRVVHGSQARSLEVQLPNHRSRLANPCSQGTPFLIGCAAIRNDRNSNAINGESPSNRFQKARFLAHILRPTTRWSRIAKRASRGAGYGSRTTIRRHESRVTQSPTHGIIMLSWARRGSLTPSPDAQLAAGNRRGTKPASACGHLM